MSYNVIITGSTGMVGKGVLLECIDHPGISGIYLINRRSVGITHAKVTEIIHKDFKDFSSISVSLPKIDGCLFCLGISSIGLSEEQYTEITYHITLSLASFLVKLNADMVFCFVSGAGTNINGRSMWSRVKGRTEHDLTKLPFKDVVLFRPGFIQPLRGIKSATGFYNIIYTILKPIAPFMMNLSSNAITNTTNIGIAMINCLLGVAHPSILNNKEINQLASSRSD